MSLNIDAIVVWGSASAGFVESTVSDHDIYAYDFLSFV